MKGDQLPNVAKFRRHISCNSWACLDFSGHGRPIAPKPRNSFCTCRPFPLNSPYSCSLFFRWHFISFLTTELPLFSPTFLYISECIWKHEADQTNPWGSPEKPPWLRNSSWMAKFFQFRNSICTCQLFRNSHFFCGFRTPIFPTSNFSWFQFAQPLVSTPANFYIYFAGYFRRSFFIWRNFEFIFSGYGLNFADRNGLILWAFGTNLIRDFFSFNYFGHRNQKLYGRKLVFFQLIL